VVIISPLTGKRFVGRVAEDTAQMCYSRVDLGEGRPQKGVAAKPLMIAAGA